jgi:hypothetical protein
MKRRVHRTRPSGSCLNRRVGGLTSLSWATWLLVQAAGESLDVISLWWNHPPPILMVIYNKCARHCAPKLDSSHGNTPRWRQSSVIQYNEIHIHTWAPDISSKRGLPTLWVDIRPYTSPSVRAMSCSPDRIQLLGQGTLRVGWWSGAQRYRTATSYRHSNSVKQMAAALADRAETWWGWASGHEGSGNRRPSRCLLSDVKSLSWISAVTLSSPGRSLRPHFSTSRLEIFSSRR